MRGFRAEKNAVDGVEEVVGMGKFVFPYGEVSSRRVIKWAPNRISIGSRMGVRVGRKHLFSQTHDFPRLGEVGGWSASRQFKLKRRIDDERIHHNWRYISRLFNPRDLSLHKPFTSTPPLCELLTNCLFYSVPEMPYDDKVSGAPRKVPKHLYFDKARRNGEFAASIIFRNSRVFISSSASNTWFT